MMVPRVQLVAKKYNNPIDQERIKNSEQIK